MHRRPFIYVCSPLAAKTPELIRANVEFAKARCHEVMQLGGIPIASHVMLDGLLDDALPSERFVGMYAGKRMVTICDGLMAFLPPSRQTESSGMKEEMDVARSISIPVQLIRMQPGDVNAAQKIIDSMKYMFGRM